MLNQYDAFMYFLTGTIVWLFVRSIVRRWKEWKIYIALWKGIEEQLSTDEWKSVENIRNAIIEANRFRWTEYENLDDEIQEILEVLSELEAVESRTIVYPIQPESGRWVPGIVFVAAEEYRSKGPSGSGRRRPTMGWREALKEFPWLPVPTPVPAPT